MPRLNLVVEDGTVCERSAGEKHELGDVTSIGRHPDSDFQVLDPLVSGQHCVIERRGENWVLCDLGSLNGTRVGGRRITGETVLRDGQDIKIGNSRLSFEVVSPDLVETTRTTSDDALAATPAQWPLGPQVDAPARRDPVEPADASPPYEWLIRYHRVSRALLQQRAIPAMLRTLVEKLAPELLVERAILFVREPDAEFAPRASWRRAKTTAPMTISRALLDNVRANRNPYVIQESFVGRTEETSGFDQEGVTQLLVPVANQATPPGAQEPDAASAQPTRLGVLWLQVAGLVFVAPADLELVAACAQVMAPILELARQQDRDHDEAIPASRRG